MSPLSGASGVIYASNRITNEFLAFETELRYSGLILSSICCQINTQHVTFCINIFQYCLDYILIFICIVFINCADCLINNPKFFEDFFHFKNYLRPIGLVVEQFLFKKLLLIGILKRSSILKNLLFYNLHYSKPKKLSFQIHVSKHDRYRMKSDCPIILYIFT